MRILRTILLPAVLALGIAVLIWPLLPSAGESEASYHLAALGKIPVMHEGRVKPLDTVARDSLLVISGRRSAETDGKNQPAMQWLLDVLAQREPKAGYRVFLIDHPQLLALLNLPADRRRFALDEFVGHRPRIEQQAALASALPARERDSFQRSVLLLRQRLSIYDGLRGFSSILPLPPQHEGEPWQNIDSGVEQADGAGSPPEAFLLLGGALLAYRDGDAATFNARIAAYDQLLRRQLPGEASRAAVETLLNRSSVFETCIALYVVAFLLISFSWAGWLEPLRRAAFGLTVLVWTAHTAGLAVRMYLQGRPPVTDLYSSAIFIGWGAVVLALAVEWLHRRGIGIAAGAVMGGLSLIVAFNLADGDSLQAMQAVLDSNFWLATHVIAVTIGYLATFLAGMIAIFYILAGVFTPAVDRDLDRAFERMVYGVVCFGLLFSFVGTVLGGIWADQSWGRFWGWDPKENGAVLIVLWNAMILHARWGGMVRRRGTMLMAVFGNVVTSWSWFGTNMLGVGLHSYGFMDSAMKWLLAFVVSQLLIIVMGLLPVRYWKSFEDEPLKPSGPERASRAVAGQ